MTLPVRLRKLPWVVGLAFALPACSQGCTFQINAGWGETDQKWESSNRLRGGCDNIQIQGTAELGLTWDTAPAQRLRVLVSSSGGILSNSQLAIDYEWAFWRRYGRELFVFAGPSLNSISGTYTIKSGYEPPEGQGVYQKVSQSGRLGLKVGAGFQLSKHWTVEVDAHFVNMDTQGAQAVPDSWTGYGMLMMSFRY